MGTCLSAGETEKSDPFTTANPQIEVAHLDLLLDPLTKDLVKTKVQQISVGEIATGQKNKELAQAEEVAKAAKEEKEEADEYRKYASAVAGIKVEISDTNAVWAAVKGWFTSKEGGIKWAVRLLDFVAIMLFFWVAALVLGLLVRKAIEHHRTMSMLLKAFIPKAVSRIILMIGFVVALSVMGFNVGTFLALIGGSAFILGFALQDTLGNFASGLMLLFCRPFDVGDVVEVGGIPGKADSVSLVNTTMRTFDNKIILVPNKQGWGQVITNATASEKRRVDMVFGISYDDDIDVARKVLGKIVSENNMVLEDPEPTIELHELADSSLNFICRPWTLTTNYWAAYWAILKAVKKEFTTAGLHIPYPQRDIHFYKEEAGQAGGESVPDKKKDEPEPAGHHIPENEKESLGLDSRRNDDEDGEDEGESK